MGGGWIDMENTMRKEKTDPMRTEIPPPTPYVSSQCVYSNQGLDSIGYAHMITRNMEMFANVCLWALESGMR